MFPTIHYYSPIDQVLSKDSAELLNNSEGKYPGPMTEIRFWDSKCINLESLYEQMKAPTTKNMASILDTTDRYMHISNDLMIY